MARVALLLISFHGERECVESISAGKERGWEECARRREYERERTLCSRRRIAGGWSKGEERG